jgi:hypothetical protein
LQAAQVPSRGDAVQRGHADVHEHDVRMKLGQLLHRLPAVGTLGDDLEAVRRREDPCQTRADDRLVVV